MPLERVGLGANLVFNERRAVGAMKRASAAFRGLFKDARKVGVGLTEIGTASRSLALGLAPLTIAVGLGASTAVKFEKQMSAVASILGKEVVPPNLAAEIKRLGATTQFTAIQAAQGAELLSRAGFSATEQIKALQPVLDAAAADNIDLATSANLVANSLRAFGKPANEAGKFAGVLATVSAKTNTNMTQLGEGLKFVAPIARGLGQSMEETSAALGLLANAGLQGTVGGTALKNMLLKLAAASDKTKAKMNALGIKVQDSQGNMLPMFQVVRNIGKALPKLGGNLKQTAFLAKTFGIRGQTAAQNLVSALKQMTEETVNGKSKMQDLADSIKNAEENLKKMAATRLNNLAGAFTLLVSAAEGFAIEAIGPILPLLTKVFGKAGLAGFLGDVAVGLQFLNNPTDELSKTFNGLGATARAVAEGVFDAFRMIREGINSVVSRGTALLATLRKALGASQVAQIAKFATLFVAAGAALAPLLLGLGALSFVISTALVPAFTGLASVISGVVGLLFGPLGIALAGAAAAFLLIRKENETFGQTAIRIWTMVKGAVQTLWQSVLQPFITGFQQMWSAMSDDLIASWLQVKEQFVTAWHEISALFSTSTQGMAVDWMEVGRFIGAVVGTLVKTVAVAVRFIVEKFRRIIGITSRVVASIKKIFGGDVMAGLKDLATAMADFVLAPLRDITLALVRLADSIPGGSAFVPAALRAFAEKGIKATIKPEPVSRTDNAKAALNREAERQSVIAQSATPNVNVDVASPKMPPIRLESILKIDGREVAFSVSSKNKEIAERSGRKATPWQRTLARVGG